MQYLPWICAGFAVLFTVIVPLCTLTKRKTYQQELEEYKHSLYYKQTRNNYNQVASDAGLYGEYLTARLLERYAQDSRFLYNLYIPNYSELTEIDCLMIHPAGVFVLESKNLSGKITGTGKAEQWKQKVRGHTNHFYSPILQNNTHVRALRRIIGQDVNIHPIVVFGDDCKLKVRHADVIQRKHLLKAVSRIVNYGYLPMSKTKLNQLYQQLKPYTQVSEEEKAKHAARVAQLVP